METTTMNDATHDNLVLKIGQLEGKTSRMSDDIHTLNSDVRDVHEKLNNNTQILLRIEATTLRTKQAADQATAQVEDLINRPTTQSAIAPIKPWNKPLGDIAGEILLAAIKAIGIGAVIALILWGIGNANIP